MKNLDSESLVTASLWQNYPRESLRRRDIRVICNIGKSLLEVLRPVVVLQATGGVTFGGRSA